MECVCYDDACHLTIFATNSIRSQLTDVAKCLTDMEYVVDKFHFKNYTDKWCKSNCNPYDNQFIPKVIPFLGCQVLHSTLQLMRTLKLCTSKIV